MTETKAFVLDVGHGSCSVVRQGSMTLVIDAGPGSTLLEFLEQQKITELDCLLISHADKDHIAGVIAVLATGTVRVRRVILNSDASKRTDTWETMLVALRHAQKTGTQFEVGITTSSSAALQRDGLPVEILAPTPYLAAKSPGSKDDKGRPITSNTASVVVRVRPTGRGGVLIAGDIDDVGLSHALEQTADFTASILVFPHHGGKPGRLAEDDFVKMLMAAVKPSSVLFSTGRGKFDTPRPAIVQAIVSQPEAIRIACTQLSERCSSAMLMSAPHLLPLPARGRERGACCAGTLSVNVDTGNIEPSLAHQAFIRSSVPTALCKLVPRT